MLSVETKPEVVELPENDDWVAKAECRTADPEVFFPSEGDGHAGARARRICRPCGVRRTCLIVAMLTYEKHGVWGGLTERERRTLRREWRRSPRYALAVADRIVMEGN